MCRLFAYGPADAIVSESPSSLASFKSRLVLLFWYRLTQVVLEKRPLNGCVHVFSAHDCLWLLEILPDPFGDPYVHFCSRCYCFTYFVFVCITAWWEFFFLIWRFTSCCYRNSFCRFSVWNKFPLQVVRLTDFGRKCNEGKINKTLLRIERSHWWWISALRASLKLRPYGTIQHTYTCAFNGPFLGLPGWAGTRKVKPIRILLKQETVSGSGISWAVCKSALCSRQKTMPAAHHSDFYRPDALPATQPTVSMHWRQMALYKSVYYNYYYYLLQSTVQFLIWRSTGRATTSIICRYALLLVLLLFECSGLIVCLRNPWKCLNLE